MDKISLVALARNHLEQARRAGAGRSAETVHGGHEKSLRQTVMALCAGRSTDDFQNPGEATVHVLVGRVRLSSQTTSWEGSPGDLIIMPRTPSSLHALEDSVLLLTVAKIG